MDNKELLKDYKENLNVFLSQELLNEGGELAKISKQKEVFKYLLENMPKLEQTLSTKDFNVLRCCIMTAFTDACEDYWINRCRQLDIPTEIVDRWAEEGYDFDMGIKVDESKIVTRFKGLADTVLYMDLDLDLYKDEEKLEKMLEEETIKIVENYEKEKTEPGYQGVFPQD